jgi:hypothetical protein
MYLKIGQSFLPIYQFDITNNVKRGKACLLVTKFTYANVLLQNYRFFIMTHGPNLYKYMCIFKVSACYVRICGVVFFLLRRSIEFAMVECKQPDICMPTEHVHLKALDYKLRKYFRYLQSLPRYNK